MAEEKKPGKTINETIREVDEALKTVRGGIRDAKSQSDLQQKVLDNERRELELLRKKEEETRKSVADLSRELAKSGISAKEKHDIQRELATKRDSIRDIHVDKAKVNVSAQATMAERDEWNRKAQEQRRSAQAGRDYLQRQASFSRETDRISPTGFMRQASQGMGPDAQIEAARATARIQRLGGNKDDVKAAGETTSELTKLTNQIKDVRRAMMDMVESSDEYKKSQEDLAEMNEKGVKLGEKMENIARDAEKRPQQGGGGFGSALMGAAGVARGIFGSMTGDAANRYVLEEQRKASELNLSGAGVSMLRGRATDAGAFLSTGGAKMFGGQSPYDESGKLSKKVDALGKDLSNTLDAGKTMEQVANMAIIAGKGLGKQTGVTGWAAGGSNMIDTGLDLATALPQSTNMLSHIGANKAMSVMSKGLGNLPSGYDDFAQLLPKIAGRAIEAVPEQNKLIAADTSMQQVNTMQQMMQSSGMTPILQEFMDAMRSNTKTFRSSVTTQSERVRGERDITGEMQNKDLLDRGFTGADITENISAAAGAMGRFGKGQVGISAARRAMLTEAGGLGSAQQNISQMGRMTGLGVESPEAMFTKAMAEGLKRGLQDSRQFQELLNASMDSAKTGEEAAGTMAMLLAAAGTGRGDDVRTARAAADNAKETMSGRAGNMMDIQKLDIIQQGSRRLRGKGVGIDEEGQMALDQLTRAAPELFNSKEGRAALMQGLPQSLQASIAKSDPTFLEDMGKNIGAVGMITPGLVATGTGGKTAKNLRDWQNSKGMNATNKQKNAIKGKSKEELQNMVSKLYSDTLSNKDLPTAIGKANQLAEQLAAENPQFSANELFKMRRGVEATSLEQMDKNSAAGASFSDQQMRSVGTGSGVGTSIVAEAGGAGALASGLAASTANVGSAVRGQIKAGAAATNTVTPTLPIENIDKSLEKIMQSLTGALKEFQSANTTVNASGDVIINGQKYNNFAVPEPR